MAKSVAQHYGNDGIVERIVGALTQGGHDMDNLDADVLAAADEFHIGGREGTTHVRPRSTRLPATGFLTWAAESVARRASWPVPRARR